MSELIQAVKDGQIQTTTSTTSSTSSTSSTSGGSTLDKNSFLQLLVAQMKYQDPLNPSSNTEYVAQLATFSQLEQMQNLSQTTTNSQAFSLVGKEVIIKTTSTTGNSSYISGRVDFVNMNSGKAQLSVNGSLYSIDLLDSVIDDTYYTEQNSPSVSSTALSYDADNPKNQTFDVNLGSEDTVAKNVAIAIDDNVIDSSLVSLSGTKVTIDKSAFANLSNGTYNVTVVFDDTNYTTVKDKVTVQVQNSEVTDTSSSTTDSTATSA